ncbi:GNAT family N-acetyltransferase [Pseudonocardia sp. TRM90224]|uniref:GNAT family N-acetyltransferase n=1 Tax=Pseudonocardia sp. TRM90224 TaxID=2812678 RepID=UPI001E5E83BE|nr:GNAT family N-acetyltransferase [Pseudonocardia sp. TRM90224]
MADLVEPTTRLYAAWRAAREDWGPGTHEDGFGLLITDDVDTRDGFEAWIRRLERESGVTYRWIVEGDDVLGAAALRHRLDGRAIEVGQVGYGVRPSVRGRGLATWALGQVLVVATTLGLDLVLIVCAAENAASGRVIERNGGVLEGVRETDLGPARRYWVELNDPRRPGCA